MKKILLLLFAILYVASSEAFAQEEKLKRRAYFLKEYGLKRHSVEFYALGGLGSKKGLNEGVFSIPEYFHKKYIGTSARFSSNWYFTPENKNRWYFRANWINIFSKSGALEIF